jgi:hypothetical protein
VTAWHLSHKLQASVLKKDHFVSWNVSDITIEQFLMVTFSWKHLGYESRCYRLPSYGHMFR